MTYIDHGTTGAYRQTWRKGNPRSLLETIIANNAKANEKRIHELFWREIEDDKQLLRACVEYWLDNNYHSLTREMAGLPKTTNKPSKPTVAAVRVVKEHIRERIAHEARLALLDWIMPNEKRLADCTGKECTKIGGWLAALAKRVPPRKTVGESLSEQQVFEIWDRATK